MCVLRQALSVEPEACQLDQALASEPQEFSCPQPQHGITKHILAGQVFDIDAEDWSHVSRVSTLSTGPSPQYIALAYLGPLQE